MNLQWKNKGKRLSLLFLVLVLGASVGASLLPAVLMGDQPVANSDAEAFLASADSGHLAAYQAGSQPKAFPPSFELVLFMLAASALLAASRFILRFFTPIISLLFKQKLLFPIKFTSRFVIHPFDLRVG